MMNTLQRIERALTRIEAAAAKAPAQDSANAGPDAASLALAEMRTRHDALRRETTAALAALDQVIAKTAVGGRI
jgi:hypothetical protein